MKTNIFLALGLFLIIFIVIKFLNADYDDAKSNTANDTSTSVQITQFALAPNLNTNTDPVIDTLSITSTTSTAKNTTLTNNPLNIDSPAQDDRHLLKGVDFSNITNFRLIDIIDDNIYLPSNILPAFGPSSKVLSIVKIGTSDQGDVYFNGGAQMLESIRSGDISSFNNIVVFTQNDIVVESKFDRNQIQFNLNVNVNSQTLDSITLLGNQLPACAGDDTREISINDNAGSITAQACENGYEEFDELNLIEIKDPNFYGCITNFRDSTVNLGDPKIKKGWVNKNDIISIDCTPAIMQSAEEIVHFPNLKKLVVSTDFPNFELLNQLTTLKYLSIYNYKVNSASFDAQQIADLNNLEFFSGYNIDLKSTHYLANLNRLKSLVLPNVRVESYEFVKYLTNVEYFDITNNDLDSFPEIGFGTKIEKIIANSNNLDNLNGFEDYINLKELLLRNNNIYSIANLDLDNSKYEKIELFANPIICNQSEMRQYSFLKVSCKN